MRLAWTVVTLVALTCGGCERGFDFERMRNQHRPAARMPPAGTVAHGEADAQPATTAELVARGERQFEIVCAVCHGDAAKGRSLMSANMPGTAPPPLDRGRAKDMSDAELFGIISRGRNRMPAQAWALPAFDRWALVAYLRGLQARTPDGSAR